MYRGRVTFMLAGPSSPPSLSLFLSFSLRPDAILSSVREIWASAVSPLWATFSVEWESRGRATLLLRPISARPSRYSLAILGITRDEEKLECIDADFRVGIERESERGTRCINQDNCIEHGYQTELPRERSDHRYRKESHIEMSRDPWQKLR